MKRFATGTGRLDARTLNELVRTNATVGAMRTPPFAWGGRWYGPILCEVNAYVSVSATGKRYRYEVVEINLAGGTTKTYPDDGFASDDVYNIAEFANDAAESSGIDRSQLPGTFEIKPVAVDQIVAVYVSAVDGSDTPMAWFDRPNEFFGACASSSVENPDPYPVQWLSGYWSSSTQYEATELVGTRHVIDPTIGADRHGTNSLRLWNGSESLTAGAFVSAGRNSFNSNAECRAWWDLYTVRYKINDETWTYLNDTNSNTTTVGGSAQRGFLNASPHLSWSGSDFAQNVTMELQVFTLPAGGPA